MKNWYLLTSVVIVLDQLTKYLASILLSMHRPVEVLPFFNFILMHNPGAAFSFLEDAGGWQRWFFSVIAAAVSVVLVMMLRRLSRPERITAWGVALILGGAVGNLIDRLWHGYVIDFIQWYYRGTTCILGFSPGVDARGPMCIFPSFNIADSAITVGAILYLYDSLIVQPKLNKAAS
ncbi:MAG: lipoprotein signal peptidase [Gammaproteobacteria bacterium]|nr:lipoprotein signal peptidase [Gammaproteobacteria bacterium]